MSESKCPKCAELEAELERARKQFGACSVCSFVAWRDRDANTEDCQYCKLEKQAAAMKDALEKCKGYVHNFQVPEVRACLESNAGTNYVSKDVVRPLVAALRTVTSQVCSTDPWQRKVAAENTGLEALLHAKNLGF